MRVMGKALVFSHEKNLAIELCLKLGKKLESEKKSFEAAIILRA